MAYEIRVTDNVMAAAEITRNVNDLENCSRRYFLLTSTKSKIFDKSSRLIDILYPFNFLLSLAHCNSIKQERGSIISNSIKFCDNKKKIVEFRNETN